MDIAELQRRLLAAARANPPSAEVPYCFEKRVMARLAGRPRIDRLAFWETALWRAAAPCVAIMLLVGAWSFISADTGGSPEGFEVAFENTVLVPLDNGGEAW